MVFIRTFFLWILVVEKGKEGMLLCDPCCSNPEGLFWLIVEIFCQLFFGVEKPISRVTKIFPGIIFLKL